MTDNYLQKLIKSNENQMHNKSDYVILYFHRFLLEEIWSIDENEVG